MSYRAQKATALVLIIGGIASLLFSVERPGLYLLALVLLGAALVLSTLNAIRETAQRPRIVESIKHDDIVKYLGPLMYVNKLALEEMPWLPKAWQCLPEHYQQAYYAQAADVVSQILARVKVVENG